MRNKTLPKLLIVTALISCLLAPTKHILAADIFDLSYQLTEGGYRLEFNSANLYKGVKVEVNTNVNAQYEVIQKVLRPLENREKPGVFLTNNFVVRGVIGTNQYGNFRISKSDVPVRNFENLYVSNTAGAQDSFTLIYGINNIEAVAPGYYSGQISFTLQPIGTARASFTKNLDVYVSISEPINSSPKIEIKTSTGSKLIPLSTKSSNTQSFDVGVNINGKFSNLFEVIHFLQQPLVSREGNQLDSNVVNFMARGATKGTAVNRNTPLSSQQQAIYTSALSGDADSNFIINYSLGDTSRRKAGQYRSRLQYFCEENGMPKILETLELEVEINRIFEVVLTAENNTGVIKFPHVKPGDAARKTDVIVQINSNLGKKYQVNQNVYGELINKEGRKIPAPYFICRTASYDTKGRLLFTKAQEIKKGDNALFVSDNAGSSDKFKVIYELALPRNENIEAGDYSTRITYSLLEI